MNRSYEMYIIATLIFVILILVYLAQSGRAQALVADPLYGSDACTLLFDDFEVVTMAESKDTSVTFAAGYLTGNSLFLPETYSWVRYSDTWWAANIHDRQESGTIEFYFRPDRFSFTSARPYGLLFTQDERAQFPLSGGLPTVAVLEDGNLSWAVSSGIAGYNDASYSSDPPLYPQQWYHIAATWGDGVLKLYVNNTLVGEAAADSQVAADRFYLGGTGAVAFAQGLAACGRIDRFRMSWKPRITGEFPCCLDVRIDTPSGGESRTVPFMATIRAFATETRTRQVDIYADTDNRGFDGVNLARGLPDSGTFLCAGAIEDTDYYLYAVARAGSDSAHYYIAQAVRLTPSAVTRSYIDPPDTNAEIAAPVAASETFAMVLLNGGTPVDGSPGSSVNTSGENATYVLRTNLVNAGDSATIHIWTKETAPAVLIGLRSDTGTLDAAHLPSGIPATETGLRAFGATALSLEFYTSSGTMLGDTKSTTSIGDTFAYMIEYHLSPTTTALFHELGFDTSAQSVNFGFYTADTYGGPWNSYGYSSVLASAAGGGGMSVKVSGLVHDLPGGLGFSASSITIASIEKSSCIVSDIMPAYFLPELRGLRDLLLGSAWGRLLVNLYYAFSWLVGSSAAGGGN